MDVKECVKSLPNSLSWEVLDIPIAEFDNWIVCKNGSALIQRNGKVTITLIPSDLRNIQLDFDPDVYGSKIHHDNPEIVVTVDGKRLLPNIIIEVKKQVKIMAIGQVKIYAER
jgi:hypothetical protein